MSNYDYDEYDDYDDYDEYYYDDYEYEPPSPKKPKKGGAWRLGITIFLVLVLLLGAIAGLLEAFTDKGPSTWFTSELPTEDSSNEGEPSEEIPEIVKPVIWDKASSGAENWDLSKQRDGVLSFTGGDEYRGSNLHTANRLWTIPLGDFTITYRIKRHESAPSGCAQEYVFGVRDSEGLFYGVRYSFEGFNTGALQKMNFVTPIGPGAWGNFGSTTLDDVVKFEAGELYITMYRSGEKFGFLVNGEMLVSTYTYFTLASVSADDEVNAFISGDYLADEIGFDYMDYCTVAGEMLVNNQ